MGLPECLDSGHSDPHWLSLSGFVSPAQKVFSLLGVFPQVGAMPAGSLKPVVMANDVCVDLVSPVHSASSSASYVPVAFLL